MIYPTNDGSFGIHGFVTGPLGEMLESMKTGTGRPVAEVVAIGPPKLMRAVSDLGRPCAMVRKHACIDGPELDAHIINRGKFLPGFLQFRKREDENKSRHGFA